MPNMTRRVVGSAAALAARTAWERLTALAATIVIARLVEPEAFGHAAVTLAASGLALAVLDAGMTGTLVRQATTPTSRQLSAARRVQWVTALALIAASSAVGMFTFLGPLLALSCLKVLTRPAVLETRVMLQRELEFRGLALADGFGQLVQAGTSILIVVLVHDASAIVGGDLAGAVAVAVYIKFRLAHSAPAVSDVGEAVGATSLLRESLHLQAVSLVVSLRDVAVTACIGAILGFRVLGLLQFATRVLSPVNMIFQSLAQLSIPLGARLLRHEDRAQRQVRAGLLVAGNATAVVLAAAGASAKWIVPVAFGSGYASATSVVAAIALALVIVGPLNSIGPGLLVAAHRSGIAVVSLVSCAAFVVIMLRALEPLGGIHAAVAAWLLMAVVEAAVVMACCQRVLRLRLVRPTLVPPLIAVAALVTGRIAGAAAHGWLPSTTLSILGALAAGVLLSTLFGREAARDLWRSSRPALVSVPAQPAGAPS
jgi:O-antigen/teichoic acid export membrane protein